MNSIQKTMAKSNKDGSKTFKDIVSFIQPYLIILINASIPVCVTKTLKFKGYLTRSDEDIAKMRRIYFFVMLNTIVLPLVSQTTILDFIKEEAKEASGGHVISTIDKFPNMIASNLMS